MIPKRHGLMLALTALCILPGVASAGPAAAGATSPEKAANALVAPFTVKGPAGNDLACNPLMGKVDNCPVTARLRTRLKNPVPLQETGNLVSRSQNPPKSVKVTQLDNNGQVAHVSTRWETGVSTHSIDDITFVVRKQQGAWFVDDTYCVGKPKTSIYNIQVGPCSAEPYGGIPKATVNTASLNLRAGASTNSAILGSYPRGTTVQLLVSAAGWVKVKAPDGKVGWMSTRYLTVK